MKTIFPLTKVHIEHVKKTTTVYYTECCHNVQTLKINTKMYLLGLFVVTSDRVTSHQFYILYYYLPTLF